MPIAEFLDKRFLGLVVGWGRWEKNYSANVIHKIVFWLRRGQDGAIMFDTFRPSRDGKNKQFDTWQLPLFPSFNFNSNSWWKNKKKTKTFSNAPAEKYQISLLAQTKKNAVWKMWAGFGIVSHQNFVQAGFAFSVFLVHEINTKSRTTPSEHFINFFL